MVQCEVIQEEKCEDVTQGYSTQQKCTKWPRKVCASSRQRVKKYTPETNCAKRPIQICGPGLCPVEAGAEQCQEKTETVRSDILCCPKKIVRRLRALRERGLSSPNL